ncbi:ATP-binding protein [Streptomyces sp. NPDC020983]|uniref:ATP-binding protein n=1 Tax=Streptomyces sp. NPDC020983 TaxID=3365106 RepID=UPI0037A2D9D0
MDTPVSEARDWTRRHLDAFGWSRTAPETADDVVLTVSELVTNAHVHARSDAQLTLAWDGQGLHVTVHDNSPELPRPRLPDNDSAGGRGIFLVEAVADTWQAHPCAHGKTVTACFNAPDTR